MINYKKIKKVISVTKKANNNNILVNLDDMIEEHEKLVSTLKSPSRADDVLEAQKQAKELEEYKLKRKEALAKGAIRRIFGNFNPRSKEYDSTKEHLEEWTKYGSTPSRDEAFSAPTAQSANEKARIFNKLANKTKMRRNPITGEREFLLFRGASPEEMRATIKGDTISHDHTTSWTHDAGVAKKFASLYNQGGGAVPMAAWVKESDIKGTVNQIDPKNPYAKEGEIFVKPNHISKLAASHELPKMHPLAKARPLYKEGMRKKVDAALDRHEAFGDHHTWLYHNADLSKLKSPSTKGITDHIGIAYTRKGRVVFKRALEHTDHLYTKEGAPAPDAAPYSHFAHPNFLTAHREAAFHKLADDYFGLKDYVPPTTVFLHPEDRKPVSVQKYVAGGGRYKSPKQFKKLTNPNDLYKLAIMDIVLGNNDRHNGNILVADGRPHLIDNGMAFDYSHMYGPVFPKYAMHLRETHVPQDVHDWIQSLDPNKLRSHILGFSAPRDIANIAANRLTEIKKWSAIAQQRPQSDRSLSGAIRAAHMHTLQFYSDPEELDRRRRLFYIRMMGGVDSGMRNEEKTIKVEDSPTTKK